jgi:hypothetical protein
MLIYTSLPDLTGGPCLDVRDKSIFHPEGPGSKQQTDYALAICARCPLAVKEACLTDALDYERGTGHCWGVWGGKTPEQRARMLGRKWRRT